MAHAMRELATRGEIDRNRLLDASLEALARDFSQYRAGWFSRFHEYMEPNFEERAARTEHYLGLLASPIPPTVAFAVKALIVGSLATLPMAFSGVAFARAFASASRKDHALGANLIGALAGAVLESMSFAVGIRALLLAVGVLYLAAALTRPGKRSRTVPVPAAEGS